MLHQTSPDLYQAGRGKVVTGFAPDMYQAGFSCFFVLYVLILIIICLKKKKKEKKKEIFVFEQNESLFLSLTFN
jgi:hypothetical protein